MNGTAQRPRYASYLPPAYLDAADGLPRGTGGTFLARFVALFEAFMSGPGATPRRLLESWVAVDALPAVLAPEISPEGDLRYEPQSRRLVFTGEMSAARRTELLALGSAIAEPAEHAAYQQSLELLAERSLGRHEELPAVEQLLDAVERYSDPFAAPSPVRPDAEGIPAQGFFDDDFLPYLASWVALTLKQHWPEAKKHRLISGIVPLYKKRGTVEGLTRVLEIFLEYPVRVTEELGIQVGVRSTVEVDTAVGGLPHMFKVAITYGHREAGDAAPRRFDFQFLRFITENTTEVLDLEKPAHTDYHASYNFPGFIVGEYSTVEWDTLIWPPPDEGAPTL